MKSTNHGPGYPALHLPCDVIAPPVEVGVAGLEEGGVGVLVGMAMVHGGDVHGEQALVVRGVHSERPVLKKLTSFVSFCKFLGF